MKRPIDDIDAFLEDAIGTEALRMVRQRMAELDFTEKFEEVLGQIRFARWYTTGGSAVLAQMETQFWNETDWVVDTCVNRARPIWWWDRWDECPSYYDGTLQSPLFHGYVDYETRETWTLMMQEC